MMDLRRSLSTIVVVLIAVIGHPGATGDDIVVRDDKQHQTALASLKNGTTLTIASGDD